MDQLKSILPLTVIFLLAAMSAISAQSPQNPKSLTDELHLNQMQVIGSHNSFRQAAEPELFKLMTALIPQARQLDYSNPSLTDQLNLGIRGLELDLYNDPEGGHYAKPLGLSLVKAAGKEPLPYDPNGKMLQPGFKVLHTQDIDFRSNCFTLDDALAELAEWSQQHPQHLPILVTMNLSDRSIQLPGSVTPVPFNADALEQLDAQIAETLQQRLITPDEIRREASTLIEGIQKHGWPTLAESRGRYLFVIDDQSKGRIYAEDHPALRGRHLFVDSPPGQPESAIMIRNSPLRQQAEIAKLVGEGYLVRTRADAETLEARRGDYRRFEAAKASGAQFISTDYYLTDWRINPMYQVRFTGGHCEQVNPVTGEEGLNFK